MHSFIRFDREVSSVKTTIQTIKKHIFCKNNYWKLIYKLFTSCES